jgi:hypothetical protein
MLVGFLVLVLLCLILKKVLVLAFGRGILRWIDPEPLVHQNNEAPLTEQQADTAIRQLMYFMPKYS